METSCNEKVSKKPPLTLSQEEEAAQKDWKVVTKKENWQGPSVLT